MLIVGPSGSGKSDLALRLIDRGAMLVSDDYTALEARGGRVIASPPANIAGRIEIRGVGITEQPCAAEAPVALLVEGGGTPERMPEPRERRLCGIILPEVTLSLLEASAPLKVEAALHIHGLTFP